MPTNYITGFDDLIGDNRTLNLRVQFPKAGMIKTMKFDAQMTVGEVCERIRGHVRDSAELADDAKECGLFLPHEDNKKGLWLDNARTLEHYILRNGDIVDYRYRYRSLVIRTMDDTKKRLRVDDSKSVAELMLLICTRMGIYNHEEYSLVREHDETDRTSTLRHQKSAGAATLGRDQEKMEKLRRKLHTDDDMDWLSPSQSLRQQGIDENEVLLLKRRYFFSDMNVDARDPIQLNLLYVQSKDAILNGKHPVSLEEAVQLAAYQCQIHFGDNAPERFKSYMLDLKEFLPKEYAKIRSVEKKIFQQHAELSGLSEIDAKVKYCQFCRSLKTYGITFFLVKERMKGKNKLIPRLLGITKDSVVRLDEKTKQVLKVWPLKSISKWAASLHAFTMDFGEYSPDECYTAQTSEGEQISQLIAGYIDIILRKQKAKDHPGLQGDEESAMYEENVQAEHAVIVQNQRLPPARQPPPLNDFPPGVGVGMHVDGDEVFRTESAGQFAQLSTANGWAAQPPASSSVYGISSSASFVEGSSMPPLRQQSPDNFMTGGTHIYHYQAISPANRALLVSIDENVEKLQTAKDQLHIDPSSDRVVFGVGSDEASQRWFTETMSASQAKVTDEVGAMNAAVAQALRSTTHREPDGSVVMDDGEGIELRRQVEANEDDPGDQMATMQQSFRVVTIHFPAFVDGVKRVAELRREAGALRAAQVAEPAVVVNQSEESAQNLLLAARNVADTFTDLLQSARPLATLQARDVVIDGVDHSSVVHSQSTEAFADSTNAPARKAMIDAASKVGQASNDLLRHVMHDEALDATNESMVYGLFTQEERQYQDQLLTLAKNVANATAGLVMKARGLASLTTVDPEAKQKVINAVTKTGLCTSQLVVCTKVLAPTIHQPSCQQQLSDAAHEVTWAVDDVVQTSRATGFPNIDLHPEAQDQIQVAVNDTETSATKVRDTLDQLNAHLAKASAKAYRDDALDNFQAAYETLVQNYTHDGQRMLTSARRMAQLAAKMSEDLKSQGEACMTSTPAGDESVEERQMRLFNAAKSLADAIGVQVETAKHCAEDPTNLGVQTELREAADQLHAVAYSAASEMFYSRLIRNLQSAARSTVTASTQLINVGRAAVEQSRGNVYQIKSDGARVNNMLPHTLTCIRESRQDPDDLLAQIELIEACEEIIQVALDNSTAQLAVALNVLSQCLNRIGPFTNNLQLDGALHRLARLVKEVETVNSNYADGTLAPLPDEKVEDCFHWLSIGVRDASAMTNDLQSTIDGMHHRDPEIIQRPNLCGPQANGLASAMTNLVSAMRGIAAATSSDQASPLSSTYPPASETVKANLVGDTREAVQLAYELVKAGGDGRVAFESNQQGNLATVLSHSQHLSSQLTDALSRCLRGLPGHREINQASILVDRRRSELNELKNGQLGARTVRWVDPIVYEKAQADLTQAAVEFNQATGDLSSSNTPGLFLRTAPRFAGAYDQMAEKGITLSTSAIKPVGSESVPQQAPSINQDLVTQLITVADNSQLLVAQASVVCARPDEPVNRNRFQSVSRNLTDSINQLLNVSTVGGGGPSEIRDCDLAIRRLELLRPLLEHPDKALNRKKYYECVDAVSKSIVPISEGIGSMARSANKQSQPGFREAVSTFTDSLCELIEETSQAAHLIQQSDSDYNGTVSIKPHLFTQTQTEIHDACRAIGDPGLSSAEMISQSTKLARNANFLFDACNKVSTTASDQQARQELTRLTRRAIQSINALIESRNQMGQPNARTDARQVTDDIDQLVQLVTSQPQLFDLSSQSVKLPQDEEAYLPISSSGLACLNSGQQVLLAAKSYYAAASSDSVDQASMQYFASGKALSESIKALASAMRTHAPGQRECDQVLQHLRQLKADLQNVRMLQINGQLQTRCDMSEEGYHRQLVSSIRALNDFGPEATRVAKWEAERLAGSVLLLDTYLPTIVSSAVGSASHASTSTGQLSLLEHTSAVIESTEQFVRKARECGGNPRVAHNHPYLEDAEKSLRESCDDLLTILGRMASRQGQVSTLLDSINRSIQQTDLMVQVPGGESVRFADLQGRLLRIARHMEQINQDIQLRAQQQASANELTPLAHTLAQEFDELSQACPLATASLPDADQATLLRSSVKAVGFATSDLVQSTTSIEPGGRQQRNQAELDKRVDRLGRRLIELIDLLAVQGPLTQTCLQSANTMSGIIADLDTTILFASSGTLHPPVQDDYDVLLATDGGRSALMDRRTKAEMAAASRRPDELYCSDNFIPLSESIERTARALVDDTQSLVSGTGSDQTRLANSTHIAVERIAQLANVVKHGAAIIGPGQADTQVDLLKGCRGAAVDLRETVLTLAKTDGASPNDSVHDELRGHRQVTVAKLHQLIKLVQAIKADQSRGFRALDSASRYCRRQADQLAPSGESAAATPSGSRKSLLTRNASMASCASSLVNRYLAPDDLAKAAGRPIQQAVARVMLAFNTRSGPDVVASANVVRDAVGDCVSATKSLVNYSGASLESRDNCGTMGRSLAIEFSNLLDTLKLSLSSGDNSEGKAELTNVARRIADLSNSLLQLLDELREGPRLVMYFHASGPEWRDVAEKYLGRHAAYHHHQVPDYCKTTGTGVDSKSVLARPLCYPSRKKPTKTQITDIDDPSSESKDEAEARIAAAIDQLDCAMSKQLTSPGIEVLRTARNVALSTSSLLQTAHNLGLAPPQDAADRAQHAPTGSRRSDRSVSLWRTELTLALSTQHLIQSAMLHAEVVASANGSDHHDYGLITPRLIPSRERLLAASRHVAASSAQLIISAKSRRSLLSADDLNKLRISSQAVKASTDHLSGLIQHDVDRNGSSRISNLDQLVALEARLAQLNGSASNHAS